MKIYNKILLIATLFLTTQSCTKSVDFNQIDDARIQSEYIVTLVNMDLTATNFLNNFNDEIPVSSDLFQIQSPNNSAEPYLEKIEFTVMTENSFDRNFSMDFVFYDRNGQPIYTIQPTIFVTENSGKVTTVLEIPQSDIHTVFNTKYIGAFLVLYPSSNGSVLDINTSGNFNLKSFMKLYFNFKTV